MAFGSHLNGRWADSDSMVLRAKTPMECTSRANFATLSLAIFALLAGVIASGSVLLNDAYFWGQSRYYINPYLFGIAFILGLPRKNWGLIHLANTEYKYQEKKGKCQNFF